MNSLRTTPLSAVELLKIAARLMSQYSGELKLVLDNDHLVFVNCEGEMIHAVPANFCPFAHSAERAQKFLEHYEATSRDLTKLPKKELEKIFRALDLVKQAEVTRQAMIGQRAQAQRKRAASKPRPDFWETKLIQPAIAVLRKQRIPITLKSVISAGQKLNLRLVEKPGRISLDGQTIKRADLSKRISRKKTSR